MEDFSNLYDDLRNIPSDFESYKKINKTEVVEHLIKALKTLSCADVLMKQQSDTIMRTTNELLKQCELSRLADNYSNHNMQQTVNSTPKSFADAVKQLPVIVMKPAPGSQQTSRDDISEMMKTTLKNVHVSKTRIKDDGTMIVEVPNSESYSSAVEKLTTNFSNFSIEESKKISPKITIVNAPLSITNEALVDQICEKDSFIKEFVKNKKTHVYEACL